MSKVVRSGCNRPSPYLRGLLPVFRGLSGTVARPCRVLDIGCGRGRNTALMAGEGHDVVPLDLEPDGLGFRVDLEQEGLPAFDDTVDVILLQYVLMFLSPHARNRLYEECRRVASPLCVAVVEFYNAKESRMPTPRQVREGVEEASSIFRVFGWQVYRGKGPRFLASRSVLANMSSAVA